MRYKDNYPLLIHELGAPEYFAWFSHIIYQTEHSKAGDGTTFNRQILYLDDCSSIFIHISQTT